VLAVGVLGVVVAVTVAALGLAQAAVGARHAANAADQAALAVAAAVGDGADPAAACALGADLAVRNAARLVACSVSGSTATARTEVIVGLPAVLGGSRRAVSEARAGPDRDPAGPDPQAGLRPAQAGGVRRADPRGAPRGP
jgi:secretion/DNA translocation related TadE-like protein